MSGASVFTIGHSSHPFDEFASLLRRRGVTAVADVRAAPYSRFNPQFKRDALAAALGALGLEYVFLGRELGGRSADPADYRDGRIDYGRVRGTERFRRGVERVVRGAESRRIALMCAEKEPLDCHRTLLVAPALEARNVAVTHILADGGVEPHAAAMDRLLDLLRRPREDLFRTRAELVADAVATQAARVGHLYQAPSSAGRDARTTAAAGSWRGT